MSINIREDNGNAGLFQGGNGIPVHLSPKGTVFVDKSAGIAYINKDSLAQWANFVDSTMITGGGVYLPLSGGTMYGNLYAPSISATTISATTFYGDGSHLTGLVTQDIYTTGFTFNPSTYDITISRNDNVSLTQNLGILASDMVVTGGTYNPSTGVATFTNNSGGTFTVSGFLTDYTDTVITAFTYNNNNTFRIGDSNGNVFNASINNVTGLTVNGILSATTISGGTFYGDGSHLMGVFDTYTTGGTFSNLVLSLYDNSGHTITVTGFTDYYTTGATLNNNILSFNRNDVLSAYTVNLSAVIPSIVSNYVPLSGGSMSGLLNTPLLSATTLTANTIENVSYIDFYTGATISSKEGRLFYRDETENLGYFTDISPNIIIDIGKQIYTRIYNNTGSLITKGTAVSINNGINSIPTITLAIASQGNLPVFGLLADDLPNNTVGMVINEGILSGVTTSNYNIGDVLFLSDMVAGSYSAGTSSLQFTSRSNQIGYVVQTGTTLGKIYVSIVNEDKNLLLTDIERNILEGNVISTGTYSFTGITQTSSTTFSIAPVQGWVVTNTYNNALVPVAISVNYSGVTGQTTPYLTTADSTYILINSGATLVMQTTFPTPQQRRQNIYLGKIIHPTRTVIQNVNNTSDYDVSPMSALRDLWTPINLINQNILVSPYSAGTLDIQTSSGTLWGNGIGWYTNQLNPNSVAISATTPTTFQYRVQTGGTFSNRTTIDPAHYDLNGTVTSVGGGANSSTNQRVYLFSTGTIRIQYGQQVYSNLTAAVTGIQTENFIENSNDASTGILIGIISVNKNATDLTNTGQAIFTSVSKFGELLGGTNGLSTTTLQQAYNNSTVPEIITNSTLDGLAIQNGTGNADNITNLFKGFNSSGITTSFIRADGAYSGLTYYGDGSNLTGINTTTGITFNNNLLSLNKNNGGSLTTYINNFSGLTVNGILSATTISGGTLYGNGSNLTGLHDYYTTGATLNNTTLSFNRNDVLSAYTVNLSALTANYVLGSGATNQVAFWSNSNTLSGNTGFIYNGSLGLGTTTPNASAILELSATTKGFLQPRMLSTQIAAILTPAVGLRLYQTDGVENEYVYKSTGWKQVLTQDDETIILNQVSPAAQLFMYYNFI